MITGSQARSTRSAFEYGPASARAAATSGTRVGLGPRAEQALALAVVALVTGATWSFGIWLLERWQLY